MANLQSLRPRLQQAEGHRRRGEINSTIIAITTAGVATPTGFIAMNLS